MIGHLRAGDIQFDRKHYQRDPVEVVIANIDDNWNPLGIGRIPISRRADGTHWGYDGQQRTLGTIRHFGAEYQMPVEIWEGMTIEDEARAFHFLNVERRFVGAIKEFTSGLLGGEPGCVAIAAVLAEFSITPVFTSASKDREIICFAALHSVVKSGGIDHLRRTLQLIDDAWNCEEETMQALFIKGVAHLLRTHGKEEGWDYAEAIRRFQTVAAATITKRSREFKAMSDRPSAVTSVYRALHETYNRGRRTRRLGDVRGR
ncbi:MAG: hypothetical protein H0U59_11155 [Gemmatimonadaceae bacterium]|nr:hypothetical protein [Gemmatimonadaceae bacterium]